MTCASQLGRALEAERDDVEMSRAQLKERAEGLSSREEELERLQVRVDKESAELLRAREACTDRENEVSREERRLKDTLRVVRDREVRVSLS